MNIPEYFDQIHKLVEQTIGLAKDIRQAGHDPSTEVEIKLAGRASERVEFISGLTGIGEYIEELSSQGLDRYQISFKVIDNILAGKWGTFPHEETILTGIKTATAILTEGVVAGSDEGFDKVDILRNSDGTEYLRVIYAGPSRSCGGTPLALSLVFADYIRQKVGLMEYKPTDEEVERLVEEARIYGGRQKVATPEEIRMIARNVPVQFSSGKGLEDRLVEIYRDLDRIDDVANNHVRGPVMILVLEGLLLKVPKLLKIVEQCKIIGWDWLKNLTTKGSMEVPIIQDSAYLDQEVAGRPVYSYAGKRGGFALRYGRSRTGGLNATNIHPSSMYILMKFPAIGTQMRVSYPGKSTIITPCDQIEPPVVKLKNGEVMKVHDIEQAKKLDEEGQIETILFNGEILISYGDVAEAGKMLLPSSWNTDWWKQEVKKKIELGLVDLKESLVNMDRLTELITSPYPKPTYREALSIARVTNTPLHPASTFDWESISIDEAETLRKSISHAECPNLPYEVKEILEKLLIPHRAASSVTLQLDADDWLILHRLLTRAPIFLDVQMPANIISYLFTTSDGIKIERKYPTIVGARMGRPPNNPGELRLMKPPIDGLIPLSKEVGIRRLMNKAAEIGKITVEVVTWNCPSCNMNTSIFSKCPHCGKRCNPTVPMSASPNKKIVEINMKDIFTYVCSVAGVDIGKLKVKGVWGLINKQKIAEHPLKGVLRAKHGLSVRKEGTIQFDLTHVPLSTFRPNEIGTSVSTIKELGYLHDITGKPLEHEDQLVELKPHDCILPAEMCDLLIKITQFVDELFEKLYNKPPFFKLTKAEDIIQKQVLLANCAPHTYLAVVQRPIGFTKSRLIYCHPSIISATRRDSDGDSNTFGVLLEWLVNYSSSYVETGIPGEFMGCPLYLTDKVLLPEVDTNIRNFDTCQEYPLELYRAEQFAPASQLRDKISSMEKRIYESAADQFTNIYFTKDTTNINEGPTITRYIDLIEGKKLSMMEKDELSTQVMKKIRAVDFKDAKARVLRDHIKKDVVGNLAIYPLQEFRCTRCNFKTRRMPLTGICPRCSRTLIGTVSEGGVRKYLPIYRKVVELLGDPLLLEEEKIVEEQIDTYFAKDPAAEQTTEQAAEQVKIDTFIKKGGEETEKEEEDVNE